MSYTDHGLIDWHVSPVLPSLALFSCSTVKVTSVDFLHTCGRHQPVRPALLLYILSLWILLWSIPTHSTLPCLTLQFTRIELWPLKIPPSLWIFSRPTAPALDQVAIIPFQGYFSVLFLKVVFFPLGRARSTNEGKHSLSGLYKYRADTWQYFLICCAPGPQASIALPWSGSSSTPSFLLPVVARMIFSGPSHVQSVFQFPNG